MNAVQWRRRTVCSRYLKDCRSLTLCWVNLLILFLTVNMHFKLRGRSVRQSLFSHVWPRGGSDLVLWWLNLPQILSKLQFANSCLDEVHKHFAEHEFIVLKARIGFQSICPRFWRTLLRALCLLSWHFFGEAHTAVLVTCFSLATFVCLPSVVVPMHCVCLVHGQRVLAGPYRCILPSQ